MAKHTTICVCSKETGVPNDLNLQKSQMDHAKVNYHVLFRFPDSSGSVSRFGKSKVNPIYFSSSKKYKQNFAAPNNLNLSLLGPEL